jgi:hypothetical protein
MKTTLDLPDDVVRAVKIRAVEENRKLKDLVADLLRRGLAQKSGPPGGRTGKPCEPAKKNGSPGSHESRLGLSS